MGSDQPVGNRLRESFEDECRHCGKAKGAAALIVPVSHGRWSMGPEWACGDHYDDQ